MKTVRYYLEIEGICTFNKLELSKKDYEEIEAKLEKKFIETEQQISNGFCYMDGTTTYRLYYRKCKEGYCFKNKDRR